MPVPLKKMYPIAVWFPAGLACNPSLDTFIDSARFQHVRNNSSVPRISLKMLNPLFTRTHHARKLSVSTAHTFSKLVVHGPVAVEDLERGAVIRGLQPLSGHRCFVVGPCLRRTHFKAAEHENRFSLDTYREIVEGKIVTGLDLWFDCVSTVRVYHYYSNHLLYEYSKHL